MAKYTTKEKTVWRKGFFTGLFKNKKKSKKPSKNGFSKKKNTYSFLAFNM